MDDREYRRAESEARQAMKATGRRAWSEEALARYLMAEAYEEERREEAETGAGETGGDKAAEPDRSTVHK
jgi:hypothetical protein